MISGCGTLNRSLSMTLVQSGSATSFIIRNIPGNQRPRQEIMHPIAPPPQSYSRLYRPWVDQDGTVTSTTHAADTSEEEDNDDEDAEGEAEDEQSRMDNEENDCSTSDYSMDRSCLDQTPPNHSHKRQHRHHDRHHAPHTQYFTSHPHPLLGTLSPSSNLTPAMFASVPSPFAYSSTAPPAHSYLLANEMEQAYHRVLAEEQRTKQLSSRKQRPKRFVCPHCDVAFSNNGQLQGHIRIHTGERPFRCDAAQCGKTFTRNEELTRHKRIHTGVRPYACDQCGKRFGRRDHLKKHARTHLVVAHHQPLHHHPMHMHPYDVATTSAAAAAAAAAVAAAMMPMYPYMFG